MRSPRDVLKIASTLLLVAGVAGAARAEVAAEVDAFGQYVRTLVISSASSKNLRIWAPQRSRVAGRIPLNGKGDLNGDLWPVVVEDPRDGNHPWVLWSRFDGSDFDIAWSRWRGGEWTPVSWLDPEGPTSGDDLDPHMAIDQTGRAHAAWWHAEESGGGGRVLVSLYLETRWMAPFLVSDEGVDSRYPTLEVLADGGILVHYETPSGPETRMVQLTKGHTITDDINPFDSLSITEPAPPNVSR